MKALLLGSVAAALMSASANAAIEPVYLGTIDAGSGNVFNYNLELSAGTTLTTGESFALVDFNGYIAGSANTSIPDFSVQVVNTLPSGSGLVLPAGAVDSSSTPDLIFTYNGPTIAATSYEQTYFDAFWAASTDSGIKSGLYVTQSGSGTVELPGVGAPSGVPEPGTWGMLLLGFFALGSTARSVRRQKLASGSILKIGRTAS